MTIWKYELREDQSNELLMPEGAKVLAVQMQRDMPCLWALVNPMAWRMPRRYSICGTGHTIPDNAGEYVGTFQIAGGDLVFHVFLQ